MRDQNRSRRLWLVLSIATACSIIALDRITKIIFSDMLSVGESIPLIRNFFHITLVHNTGIAFGLFKDQGIIFVIIPIIVIIFIVWYLHHHKTQEDVKPIHVFAFSLILGGAIGNLIDRISLGYVVDFFDFRIWPVFNIADSAITIGITLILLKTYRTL